jgi:glutaredoxin
MKLVSLKYIKTLDFQYKYQTVGEIISYKNYIKKVPGKKKGDVLIFALSTCVWCMKTKKLFKDLGVEYGYIDVDLLSDKDKQEASNEIYRWNKSNSFPTVVINNKKAIIGFDEKKIRDFCGSKRK